MMFAISTKLTLFDIHADFGIYYFKISEPRAQSLEAQRKWITHISCRETLGGLKVIKVTMLSLHLKVI
jgi:hypothetical protein